MVLNKIALRCHLAEYFQVNNIMGKIMEKLEEEMEHSRILNNNKRDSQEQIMSDILYCLFSPDRISKKKKKNRHSRCCIFRLVKCLTAPCGIITGRII